MRRDMVTRIKYLVLGHMNIWQKQESTWGDAPQLDIDTLIALELLFYIFE
jgi:hypothetical protein